MSLYNIKSINLNHCSRFLGLKECWTHQAEIQLEPNYRLMTTKQSNYPLPVYFMFFLFLEKQLTKNQDSKVTSRDFVCGTMPFRNCVWTHNLFSPSFSETMRKMHFGNYVWWRRSNFVHLVNEINNKLQKLRES